jgi:hypothetical protein
MDQQVSHLALKLSFNPPTFLSDYGYPQNVAYKTNYPPITGFLLFDTIWRWKEHIEFFQIR